MLQVTPVRHYGAIEFAELAKRMGRDAIMRDKDLRELFYCHPLMMREALSRNTKMGFAKVAEQNNPIDVFIYETRHLVRIANDRFRIEAGIAVQLKEIVQHGRDSTMPLDEWVVFLQKQVGAVGEKIRTAPNGVLHFHNKIRITFDTTGADSESLIEIKLRGLRFREGYPYTQVTISFETLATYRNPAGLLVVQIYPKVEIIGTVSTEADFRQLRQIYGLG